jgi:uncharacterized protein YwbE
MTTAEQQHRARQALAFVAGVLRPDWDSPGTIAVIESLHRDRQPLGVIAKATIDAALTTSTKTPGGIRARVRDGFDGSDVRPATPDTSALQGRCKRCGHLVVRGEDHPRHCHPRAADQATARQTAFATKEE